MPIDFNKDPYYDDFTEDDRFYRLLFQPGRAVQARELTQIQSYLQNQIEKLGRHLFKDGAQVIGGKINYDRSDTKWLAVQAQDIHGNPVRMRDISPGMIISKPPKGSSSMKTGTITSVREAEGNDPNTIYFKWTTGSPESGSEDDFQPNEMLVVADKISGRVRYNLTTLDTDSLNNQVHTGTAANISVEPGIYFYKGIFVNSDGGHLNLSKYSNQVTFRIGYMVQESVIQNDPKTLDPAAHARNYSAPGADRYSIKMTLVKIGDGIAISERIVPNFIEICRVENGNLIADDSGLGSNIYNILGDQLARRTFEESGNYIAESYDLKIKNKTTTDNPKMIGSFSKGVSYVYGHRRGLNRQSTLEIDKGRDVIKENNSIPIGYGDNYLLVYDEANTSIAAHPENANGLFVVGSGAGQHTTNIRYGNRGSAVSIHSVPKQLVIDYGLGSEAAWKSTLVGTARPVQMVYNDRFTENSHRAGRNGDVYNLWLGDFKSSPITDTISVTNVIELAGAYANTEHTVFHFNEATTHELSSSDDRISIVGTTGRLFNIDGATGFAHANTTAITFSGLLNGIGATTAVTGGRILRTTGNTSPFRTAVLAQATSAPWNGSYIGATISVGNSTPKTIVDYIGTNADAKGDYATRNTWARAGMVVVDSDFEELPKHGDSYTINFSAKQARSVVYNQNKSTTGVEAYPAILNQAWNVDPISGVKARDGQDNGKLNDDLYGNRVDGDATYNILGAEGHDALLFDVGRKAVKSLTNFGTMDVGYTANTELVYTEYSVAQATSTASNIEFAPGASGTDIYRYFHGADGTTTTNRAGITVYPYETRSVTLPNEIKRNFMLVERDTGKVLTNAITEVAVNIATHNITITSSVNFVSGREYVLNFPVKASYAKAAYKKLIKANTSHSVAPVSNMSDLTNGQILSLGHEHGGLRGNTAGSRIDLLAPDAFKNTRINRHGFKVVHQFQNDQDEVDLANTILDVSDRFDLDSGQRDTFYDNASLILKDGVDAPTGNVMVCFDRFIRTSAAPDEATRDEELSSPGFFSVDSYHYTTDLRLDHNPSQTGFVSGMEVRSNSGIVGYVLDFANTAGGGYSKIRLQDIRGPVGVSNPEFTLGEFITGYHPTAGKLGGQIQTITKADITYNQIPQYQSPTGKNYPLRNMIDVRPYVSTNNMVSDTLADSILPLYPSRSSIMGGRTTFASPSKIEISSESFAGRIDKLVVTSDGKYEMHPGNPSFTKYPPKDKPDNQALTLYTLEIPDYTFNTKDVQIVENKAMRHTMKDIGRLAKRVENLEYYVSLDALEKQTSVMEITDSLGNSRFKNGILVDNFDAHNVYRRPLSKISLEKGVLRPQSSTLERGRVAFSLLGGSSGVASMHNNYVSEDGEENPSGVNVMLDYTTKPFAVQPIASSSESVNPFDLQNFTGQLEVTPNKDSWIDTTKIPEFDSVLTQVYGALEGLDENSTADEIADTFRSMGDFWSDIAGTNKVGDDIVGTSVAYSDDLESSTIEKNIELGSARDQYFNTAQIDAAIAMHGVNDGVTKNIKFLPYIRSRDIIVRGDGLKPNHLGILRFDDVIVETNFARANEIYIEYDPKTSPTMFQPDATGQYEKITLSADSGNLKANATLLAIREPNISDQIVNGQTKYMIGYIVPEMDSVDDDGKINYSTFKDGYYGTSWDTDTKIRQHGFHGSATGRTITGTVSTASATIMPSVGTTHYYNGAFTGSARNTGATAANTTHIELSPDAWRFVDANFRKSASSSAESLANYTGYAENCYINIVAGAGAGQQCIANGIVAGAATLPVIELRNSGSGTGLTTGIDSTSVYSISMKPVDPTKPRYSTSMIGDYPGKTNSYGEKFGILRIPSESRRKFTAGRKLVEISDRYSRDEWLVSSYASGYYEATGVEREEVEVASPQRLEMLKEIRTKVTGFRILDHPTQLGYVPATDRNDGKEGRLAVVTGISFDHAGANNTWTAKGTHDIDFVPGGAPFGAVDEAAEDFFVEDLVGVWKDIRENNPDIYEKYFSLYGDVYITDGTDDDI